MARHELHDRRRIRLTIGGCVQGVGFRPCIARWATELQLGGTIRNEHGQVTIDVEGPSTTIATFLASWRQHVPSQAVIDSFQFDDQLTPLGVETFHIVSASMGGVDPVPHALDASHRLNDDQPQQTNASGIGAIVPDLAVCVDCLREMLDPANRRFQYPFINCAHCGPRLTIVRDLPYERDRTTMAAFPKCAACEAEYRAPTDRRYHAEGTCCPTCGPLVWYVENQGPRAATPAPASPAETTKDGQPPASSPLGAAAIDQTIAALRAGQIVAIKGLGGFHLACDPRHPTVVATLRARKGRGDKPFAVMTRSAAEAGRWVELDQAATTMLESPARPIVLLPKLQSAMHEPWVEEVAPRQSRLGVLLPYTPLHALLLAEISPLVMTSANPSEEPLCHSNDAAISRLAAIADGLLCHDRVIEHPCDDSVIHFAVGRPRILRRARGWVPTPLRCADSPATVLAIGGDQKGAFCLLKGPHAHLSQHLGDWTNWDAAVSSERELRSWLRLQRCQAAAIAVDKHPGFASHRVGVRLAADLGAQLIPVQHHAAHAAALLAEHSHADPTSEPPSDLIACCFDGTGYGDDGSIWGGEFLLMHRGQYTRVAHWKPFLLPGGDLAIREPKRIALALLHATGLPWSQDLPAVAAFSPHQRQLLAQQLERQVNCVPCSSLGRLFDGISALLGICSSITYEAQAAIELECRAQASQLEAEPYPFTLEVSNTIGIHPDSMLAAIVEEIRNGRPVESIARRFHHTVIEMAAQVCERIRDVTGINTIGLTGGVFQNALLETGLTARLQAADFRVLLHERVPMNDGGLALGQALIARQVFATGVPFHTLTAPGLLKPGLTPSD